MRIVYNGNFNTTVEDVRQQAEYWFRYTPNEEEAIEEIVASVKQEENDVLLALKDVTIKHGYSTSANGSCHDLTLEKGERIQRISNGDAYSFSKYKIW